MKDQRIHELKEQSAAALVKFDRCLTELERLGARRVNVLQDEIADFDVVALKSVVFDIQSAQERYTDAQKELRRIQ